MWKGDYVYYPRMVNIGGMNFYTVRHLYEHLRERSPADQLALVGVAATRLSTVSAESKYSTVLRRALSGPEMTWHNACRDMYRQSFPEASVQAIMTRWVEKYESEAALIEPVNADGSASALSVWICAPDFASSTSQFPACLRNCAKAADAFAADFVKFVVALGNLGGT